MKATFARKNSPDTKKEDNHDSSTSKTNELPNRIFSYATSRLDGVAGKLHREYRFANFGKAFGFMKTAAPAIEKMDHHPEWFNAYDRVVVDLTTHDAGGISQKDVDLARQLEEIASKLI
jgi:4a-hydroxytetrahydrobiopterin dehydratase